MWCCDEPSAITTCVLASCTYLQVYKLARDISTSTYVVSEYQKESMC